jgi:FMN phosphatase YigB (HAD superfamily)
VKIIFDYNRTIFNPDKNEFYPGVFELISDLYNKHELFLISKVEPNRKEVLDNFGISNFFKRIIFTDNKSAEIFKEITGVDNNVVVVGDRVRGEITIGNQLGYITVWIKQGKFSEEKPINKEQEPKYTIQNIIELKTIISLCEKI